MQAVRETKNNMLDIIPGIFETNFEEIRNKVKLAEPFVQWVQLDFSDGSLVPKESFFDVAQLATLVKEFPSVSFEAHLMVSKPEKYVKALSDAGFKRVIAQIECTDVRNFLDDVQYESMEAGVAIDGPTENELIEPFLGEVDCVLVMTVEAGESGRPFLPETVEKIRAIHEAYPDLPVEVDGGMNETTAKLVADAGATRLVSTSYVFKDHRRVREAIAELKG